jgi:hypothetical protein
MPHINVDGTHSGEPGLLASGAMSAPTGYLVVRCIEPFPLGADGSLRLRYLGVDRLPAHPSDDENERDALEEYVFGGIKNDVTNLIPSLDAAVRLQRLFAASKHGYEILFCSEGPRAAQSNQEHEVPTEQLGYDVAAIRGDYWSIVADLSSSDWAARFRSSLNAFGLFARRDDAEAYLREYLDHDEPDSDSPFEVVYVTRVRVG